MTPIPCRGRVSSMSRHSKASSLKRLSRIEGQVRGIRRMIEEPRLCVDILQQLAAATAALERVSGFIIKFHVERCVGDTFREASDEQRRRQLAELVDIFDRFRR